MTADSNHYTTERVNELLLDPDATQDMLCAALYNVHEDYLVLKEDMKALNNALHGEDGCKCVVDGWKHASITLKEILAKLDK